MQDCIFCKIVKGELPSYKVYEDDKFLGFLDIRPMSLGNSLIIPKEHHRWVYDVPEFGEYWEAAKKIALASIKALNAQSVSFLTLGYEIPHSHIRIIPRFQNDIHKDGLDIHHVENVGDNEMAEISQKIRDSINK
jgi:histidine triad (HIT) family protein